MMTTTELEVGTIIDETPEDDANPEEKLTHYAHPTDSTILWCGAPKDPIGFADDQVSSALRSCPICADLTRRMGAVWWWNTHRRFYESACQQNNHCCIAL